MHVADQRVHQFAFLAFGLGPALTLHGFQGVANAVAKQAFQVFQRDARFVQLFAIGTDFGRRGGRYVEHIGLRAPFRVQRQGHLVFVHQNVDGAVSVVQIADPADTPDTLPRTGGRQALFNARIAENAFFRFGYFLVEVDLFVGTGVDAITVAATAFLVDQDDAVFLALVDGIARTGGQTGRVGA